MFLTIIISGLCISISLMSLYLAYKEILCVYRNPFPLFANGTKKFSEIQKKPTRSILKDIHIPDDKIRQDLE